MVLYHPFAPRGSGQPRLPSEVLHPEAPPAELAVVLEHGRAQPRVGLGLGLGIGLGLGLGFGFGFGLGFGFGFGLGFGFGSCLGWG